MGEYTFSAEFGVVPELVFEALTDPERVARWLPGPWAPAERGAGVLRVRLSPPDGPFAQSLLPIGAGAQPGDRWLAEAVVVATASGSRVDVTVTPQCPPEQLKELAAQAVDGLRDDIAESFTPG